MSTSVASSGRSYVLDGGQGVYYAVAALTCISVLTSVASSGRSYVLDGGQGVYYAVPLC